jgi:hypothetical protein
MKDISLTLKQAYNISTYWLPLKWKEQKTLDQKVDLIVNMIVYTIIPVFPILLMWWAYKHRSKVMANFHPDGSYEFV